MLVGERLHVRTWLRKNADRGCPDARVGLCLVVSDQSPHGAREQLLCVLGVGADSIPTTTCCSAMAEAYA